MNYKILGNNPKIEVVIEMGLGSVIAEWMPLAKKISQYKTVLLYERNGVNMKEKPVAKRTAKNICLELYELLSSLPHNDKLILIGHSQGGLYAYQMVILYKELFSDLILLDPLSFNDNYFKEHLSVKEYNNSGVDKSKNFEILARFARLKLSFIPKLLLRNAPPFYYYKDFSKEEKKDILNSYGKLGSLKTISEEYFLAHDKSLIPSKQLIDDVKLTLVTHNKVLAIKENQEFGNNTFDFAKKIEDMWQKIMQEYLSCFANSCYIEAPNSTHYIHLTDQELLISIIHNL